MTQPSTPTLTPVVGVPATITNLALLRGQATFDGPYLGGPVGAGIGSIPFEWDTTSGGWKNSNTDGPLELPLARTDVPAAIKPQGWLYIDLTWVDEAGRRQSEQLRFRPAAGDDGQLDLTRDQDPEAYTTTASLQALTADAEQAAAAANTAAGRVNDAILDLSAERQAVADIIADTAQSAALAAAAAGITPRATLAAITGPDGYYRAMDTGEVYQRETVGSITTNTRRRDLEPTSAASVRDLTGARVVTRDQMGGMHITQGLSKFGEWHPEMGYTSLRLGVPGVGWNDIATARGVYKWATLDAYVAEAQRLGLSVLHTGMTPPAWAVTGTPAVPGHECHVYADSDLYDFYYALANRYKGKIAAYEGVNEPNDLYYYDLGAGVTEAQRATRLAHHQRVMYTAVKAADPSALVVSACPTSPAGVPFWTLFMNACAAQGVPAFDVLGFHDYVFPSPPEAMIGCAMQYRAAAEAAGYGNLPLWNTEYGYNLFIENGITSSGGSGLPMSDTQAQGYVQRMILCTLIAGIDRSYWYNNGRSGPANQGWVRLALRGDDGNLTGAGVVYQRMLSELDGAQLYGYQQVGQTHQVGVTFRDGRRGLYVWSGTDSPQVYALPTGTLATTAREGFAMRQAITQGQQLTVSKRPLLLLYPPGATPTAAASGSGGTPADLLYNRRFRVLPNNTLDGWICSLNITTPAVPDAPAGTNPPTLTAGARYQGFSQVIPTRLQPGRKYRVSLTYKTLDAATGWRLGITAAGTGVPISGTGYQTVSPSTGGFSTLTYEFTTTSGVLPGTDTNLLIAYQSPMADGETHGIIPAEAHFYALDGIDVPPIRTRYVADWPAMGSFITREHVLLTDPTAIRTHGHGLVVTDGGTLGALAAGVTASNTVLYGNQLTINTPDALRVDDVINIAGSGQVFTIIGRVSATVFEVNYQIASTFADAAVTYHAPTFALLNGQRFDAVQLGPGASTTGLQAAAVGNGAQAAGQFAAAFGRGSAAGGQNAAALGPGSTASGLNSTAAGQSSAASGGASLAAGFGAVAAASNSVALGQTATVGATHTGSTALGSGATTTAANQVMLGTAAHAVAVPGTLSVTGAATLAGISVTGITFGTAALALGFGAAAGGSNSTALGSNAQAAGQFGTAVGRSTTASGSNSGAFAVGATASGPSTIAIGPNASATHTGSTAVGNGATTTANNQVMLGTATETVVLPGVVDLKGAAVTAAAGAASTHKIAIKVGGVTYYLLASNT